MKITLPEMGESVTEGSVIEWRKKVGEWVEAGEPLVEVTTDKVDVEVPAPASGRLAAIATAAGATVAVGAALGEIDTSAKAEAPPAPAAQAAAPSTGNGTAPEPAGVSQPVDITLPELGESVTEGSVIEWRKKAGDFVQEGEALVEVTTDKVDVEVPAPASGRLLEIRIGAGQAVAVGATLGVIERAPTSSETAIPPGAAALPAAAAPAPPSPGKTNGARVASPQAQRLAKRRGVDLGSVAGSGPGGLILHTDVEKAPAGTAKPTPAAGAPRALPLQSRVTPLGGPAGALVGYMEASLTIPTATSFRTLAVGALESRRVELNAALRGAGRSEKLSFTHLIAFAIVRAAREQPGMVAWFKRAEDGKPQKVNGGVHLGLAVDVTRKDGSRLLIVPVIKNADTLNFDQFRAAYDDLVVRSRDNTLTTADLSGATITLTNPGGIGTSASVPRLMAGQAAIIATGSIGYPPGFGVLADDVVAQLGVQKVMTLTSTYDHRVIQGAQSGEFLRRLEALLGGADGFYDSIFGELGLGTPKAVAAAAPSVPQQAPADELLAAVAAAMALVKAHRTHGHLAAQLDPLGSEPIGDPALDPRTVGLTPALMSAIPASILRVKVPGNTMAEVLPRLHATYCGTIAYEIEHLSSHQQRLWLREWIEGGKHRVELSSQRRVQLLQRLTKAEMMERFLRKTFLGAKTFSAEGLESMIVMLEETLTMFADDDVRSVVMGMAHRGRLNIIAHVVNRPYEELLVEFEATEAGLPVDDSADVTGDVKYHIGAEGQYVTADGKTINVLLTHNPSHLEAVDPVVEGRARALQTDHAHQQPSFDLKAAVPVLIHGDAAFPGQGVVAEVLNLQALAGYSTGGTFHIISNNQIGFTTDPTGSRSTRYASDLAKGFDIPIIHVNADDIDACIAAVHLAVEFRKTFKHDVLIDLIGYRRFGHNETDEPAYTQPKMYEKIKAHPSVRELFARHLINQGIITKEAADAMAGAAEARLKEAHQNVKSGGHVPDVVHIAKSQAGVIDKPVDTRVDRVLLETFSEELLRVPPGFTINPKLLRQLERRAQTVKSDGEVDWGLAEALAFASLVADGTPIRFTGQDTERGTFSHRHLVYTDPHSGQRYAPIQHLHEAKASFEVWNSPLSEYACLGFEYGYSAAAASALVLWEAQFGDFVNGAEIIVDQFIAAGMAKWGQSSRLTLLLPHGYEGGGPEHSSARLERFLQLSAEGNIRIANCSTASQYFHLLRGQARSIRPQPLIVMTPKSLLRMRAAGGTLEELSSGSFKPVIDDANVQDRKDQIERVLLCSGKIYYDLVLDQRFKTLKKTAIVRVELLSPLPYEEIVALLGSYKNAKEYIWVQEEPKNMGARAHVRRRLIERLAAGKDLDYIGRPYRASPSEGYHAAHAAEQERIVAAALTE